MLSETISNHLISNGTYQIQSNIQYETLQEFTNYLINHDQAPILDVGNIYQYFQLSREFSPLLDDLFTLDIRCWQYKIQTIQIKRTLKTS